MNLEGVVGVCWDMAIREGFSADVKGMGAGVLRGSCTVKAVWSQGQARGGHTGPEDLGFCSEGAREPSEI